MVTCSGGMLGLLRWIWFWMLLICGTTPFDNRFGWPIRGEGVDTLCGVEWWNDGLCIPPLACRAAIMAGVLGLLLTFVMFKFGECDPWGTNCC